MDETDYSLPWPDAVHPEQFPGTIARDAALVGHRHADLDKPFVYCDLGCGRGATLLSLAASFPDATFYGVDSDEERIAHARSEAEAAGLGNLTLIEGHEGTSAIPPCDFVSLHGVLTWMPTGSEREMFALAHRLLKDDGLMQVQVSLLPGWAQMTSLRRIIRHAAAKAEGDAAFRAQSALGTALRLCRSDEPFAETNPTACKIVEAWHGKDLSHVARDMLGLHARYFSIGEILDAAEAQGFECCGPLHHDKPHGRAYLTATFPGCDLPSAREDFISHAKAEFHRSLVFRKTGPDSPEIGYLALTGTDIVGFQYPTRWSEEMNLDFSVLHDQIEELDELPLWLGSVTAHSLIDVSLREDLDSLREIVGNALIRRKAVLYARMTEDFEAEGPLRAVHPLTTRLLETPRTYRFGAHLPSPILGGGVAVAPEIAALLKARLDAAEDLAAAARSLIAEMDENAPPFAITDPQRVLPDPEAALEDFESRWLPFFGRLRVIERADQ